MSNFNLPSDTTTIFVFYNFLCLPTSMFKVIKKKKLGLIAELPVHPEDYVYNTPECYYISLSSNINPYINKLIKLGFKDQIPCDVLTKYNKSLEQLRSETEFNKFIMSKEERARRIQNALKELDNKIKEKLKEELKTSRTDFERCRICGKLIDGRGLCFCNDVYSK